MSSTVKPLLSRPLDAFYFAFFILHIPIFLLIDFQVFCFPLSFLPKFITDFPAWYLSSSGDPMLAGALALHGQPQEVAWLNSLFMIQVLFQFPTFFVAAWALYNDRRAFYPLILIYGASTLTTLIPSIAYLKNYPTAPMTTTTFATVTEEQKKQIINSLIPWLVIPTGITLDFGLRIARIIGDASARDSVMKAKTKATKAL